MTFKGYAQQPSAVTSASWKKTDQGITLSFGVFEHLDEKQKKLINSGFSTLVTVEVWDPTLINETIDQSIVFRSSCTVLFDTWEDNYLVTRISAREREKNWQI